MYALAVMMSRSEDAVQTCYQAPVLHKVGADVPCGGSWKSSCQSCKGVGRGDRIGVGSTCPSPNRQSHLQHLSYDEISTYLSILPTPLAQFLQFVLHDRTLPIPQKSPIPFLR